MRTIERPRRVLILTLSFGSGHLRAADAVTHAVGAETPTPDVLVVDVLAKAWWPFRVVYVWPYWIMLRYFPGLWRRLFAARLRRKHARTAPAWLFRFGCSRVFTLIAAFAPDVIVATEVAAFELAGIAKGAGVTDAPIVNVITDHHAEPVWVAPYVSAYAVGDDTVAEQLIAWGARADRIVVSGIPTSPACQASVDPKAVRARYGITGDRPVVLVMGGGMGPTHMDAVVGDLCASRQPMHIVAVAGLDRRMHRRVSRLRGNEHVSTTVLGWTDDVAELMQTAALLVTKPGGVTTAEAAVCGCPVVFFDGIPGPEEHNAAWAVARGGCLQPKGRAAITAAIVELLRDHHARAALAARARGRAMPLAATTIATLASRAGSSGGTMTDRAVVILTIRNGAGHTRTAEAIGRAVEAEDPAAAVSIVDVADYMTFVARLTHVTLFLWLVKHTPRLWARIDRFQKHQTHTSPDWYYRRGCSRLFALVRALRPVTIVATEVGCCEIAVLVARDLGLSCPIVAVNGEYDADRAWVQAEVALYSVPDATVGQALCGHGADERRVHAWGVPLDAAFLAAPSRASARDAVCSRLDLQADRPIVLVSGGSEALGHLDAIVDRLLALSPIAPQIVVLAGRNRRAKQRCDALAVRHPDRTLRVLAWTPHVCDLMAAADLMVSKLGHTFDEAIALGVPLVALPPPPGSEEVQFRLLHEWRVGRAVATIDEMADAVANLLAQPAALAAMRAAAAARPRTDAAQEIARWIITRTRAHVPRDARLSTFVAQPAVLSAKEQH